ncbi:hypothetical protein M2163_008526 [Streptomyces sp. SAI-135]|uniref:hypothetical protein n=1 Tax=unclassified Streptomyces TaxID=2593676 RepID=UPI002474A1D4|nr:MULTISPECIES: hypothetical protein [unclassified Streptomyces]MDH6514499.1 hypothetical protein [Streptomyces sp. SAI-090]MDH6546680.1 hypothetical protein [Streptomyces sp. SAI-041]MDH6621418.1 hypothetical protein [Streptomyces sp. SAI-135]
MTTLLETRYRAVLRLLPAYYRREREEEMVETYLWDVDPETQEQSRPTLGEVASIVALAVRSRLGAPAAPRRYAVLGSAVRLFALFAVLLQAASAVVDRVLELTWASTRGGRQWDMFTDGFAGHGAWAGAGAVVQWFLPLLWTVAYFALLRDHRRLAQVSSLAAAVPTLWPLADLWARAFAPSDSAYVLAAAVLAWASALALCAAHHRDAPPAVLPAGAPGLVFAACCVLMGGSVVALPGGVDTVWALVTCYLVAALAWLLYRVRGEGRVPAGEAAALAALGLLLLVVRITAVYPWLDVLPGALRVGVLTQAAALVALTAALAVVSGRALVSRGT